MNFVEKDNVDLSPECVIAAPLQVRLVESLLENFSIAINSVNISDNVALFEANPLNESQNKVSSIFDEQRTKISSMLTDVANLRVRITDVKNAFIKANPDFESLYTQIELEYSLLFNNLDYSDQSDYIVNIYDLMEKYQMGTIYEEGNKNVADLYNIIDENGNVVMDSGMTFFNDKLDSVLENYSGRYATVNSVLMAFQLAADKGVKYCYTNSGANLTSVPYNTNEQLVDGMDCCAFVSWAINKGSEKPFHWQGLQGLSSIGEEIDYDVALPGDIFVKANSDGSGHVGLIISNDPENKTFIVAEARGPGYGITLNFINYEELQKMDIR